MKQNIKHSIMQYKTKLEIAVLGIDFIDVVNTNNSHLHER